MKTIIISLAIVFSSSLLYSQIVPSQSNMTYDAGTDITVQAGADICADAIIINGTWSGNGTKCQAPLLVETTPIVAPRVLSLAQNYPNPFNPTTTIEFTVPKDGHVSLTIYNSLGQLVATVFDGEARAGYIQRAMFDASQLASGVYFSRLQYNEKMLLKKLVLMK
ncbi:MAG: T9SS type A sorting domain-containing protein [Bacteroidota bacterium]